MTPEQKAFLACGEARGILKGRIDKIRRDARHIFGEPYCFLSSKEKENIWFLNHLKSLIIDYRRKRAACRAWLPLYGRRCNNCLHMNKICDNCCECAKVGALVNWEPRKEGE